MSLKLMLLLTFAGFLTISCENNSPNDLEGDIPANVTYTEHVRPIIQSNCIACHQDPPINGAPMPLTDYEKVKQAVLTRPLLDRISRTQGAEGMMPNGGQRLPQYKIDIIAKWQAQNFQN
ncbi:hypothetical protein [Flavobacterium sp.]|uniref:hypothetical protein n=1 Tax=Flavobacterium sp. TaxID=239 RepID=UPI00286D1839|nr:hypothetical protein [Flavobacterium sp.]